MRRVLTFLFIISTTLCFAQNIIYNGAFTYGNSAPWRSILSVDYYSAVDGWTEVGQEGRIYTADGNGCVGVRAYSRSSTNWQEYIYQHIGTRMKADTVYRVSIKYRLAPRCQYGTDAMGIGFFSGYSYSEALTEQVIRQKVPEIRNTPGKILENNNMYHELVGYYKATGEEDIIAFGSFATDATMLRSHITLGPPYLNAWQPEYGTGQPFTDILYYMDMASITPCVDYPADPFPDQRIFCSEQLAVLHAPPIDSAQFLWSTGDTTSEIQVQAQNQEVWLEITKNGCVRRDTVKLTVFSGAVDLGADRKICSADELPVVLSVNSLPGEQVTWNTGATGNTFSATDEGTYWVMKTLDDCIARDTVSIINLEDLLVIYPNPVEKYLFAGSQEEVKILQLQTEDGKLVFKGEETPELLADFIETLTPAVYFLTANVNRCILKGKLVKKSN